LGKELSEGPVLVLEVARRVSLAEMKNYLQIPRIKRPHINHEMSRILVLMYQG
jgi:hypothetical protein